MNRLGLHAITVALPSWLAIPEAITLLDDPLDVILAADKSEAITQTCDDTKIAIIGFAM